MIETSYFGKMKKMPIVDQRRCMAIVYNKPYGIKLYNLSKLAPSRIILLEYKLTGNEHRYREEYFARLYQLGINRVISTIPKDAILCCFEKSEDFCHRHLLREFLAIHGVESKEYELPVNEYDKDID